MPKYVTLDWDEYQHLQKENEDYEAFRARCIDAITNVEKTLTGFYQQDGIPADLQSVRIIEGISKYLMIQLASVK